MGFDTILAMIVLVRVHAAFIPVALGEPNRLCLAPFGERRVAPASRSDFASERSCGSHRNTQLCCGLFDRTSAHLKEQNEGNIVDNPKLLADILERYNYALL